MRVLKPFEYFEPRTIEEASNILFMYGDKAKPLAGGLDLVPRMRGHCIQPDYVVSIGAIPGLDYIKDDGEGGLRIGAMASIRSIETEPLIQKGFMVLYEAANSIAHVQVKTMGTAVGNLCVATPASDIAVASFVLGAEVRTVSPVQERTISLENFFTGVNRTVLGPGEIVTEIYLPGLSAGTGSAFLKLVRTAGDAAKVNVAVRVMITDGICKEVILALGSVAPTTIRARKAEELLRGQRIDRDIIEATAKAVTEEAKPITDLRSTAEYRKEVTRVLVSRALVKAIARAKA